MYKWKGGGVEEPFCDFLLRTRQIRKDIDRSADTPRAWSNTARLLVRIT